MDVLDRKMIAILQEDGRISVTDLAEQLPLSLSATSERLRRLTDGGVITGFHATIDPDLAGRPIEALVDVRLAPGSSYDESAPRCRREVLDAGMPILGVCLGHQSIGQATGATIVRAKHLMHGKTDEIHHDNRGLFAGLPNPFVATRYHSLVIQPETLSGDFDVSAWAFSPDGEREIMAIRHKSVPLEGWQFHPESFLTEPGCELLRRFIEQ